MVVEIIVAPVICIAPTVSVVIAVFVVAAIVAIVVVWIVDSSGRALTFLDAPFSPTVGRIVSYFVTVVTFDISFGFACAVHALASTDALVVFVGDKSDYPNRVDSGLGNVSHQDNSGNDGSIG